MDAGEVGSVDLPFRHGSAGLSAVHEWIMRRHPGSMAIDLDTDLLDNRLIDSLEFAEFLFVLEEAAGRRIDLERIDLNAFRTLRSIQRCFFAES